MLQLVTSGGPFKAGGPFDTPGSIRDAIRGAGSYPNDGDRRQGTFQTVCDVSPERAHQLAQQAKHYRNMRHENAWRGTST